MKRAFTLPIAVLLAFLVQGQVSVDRPVVLTAAADSARRITGLVQAQQGDALITAGEAQVAAFCWATTSGTTNTLLMTTEPPVDAYRNGLLIRWSPHRINSGAVRANVNGLGSRRIYRADGLPLEQGALDPGSVAEIVYWDTAFFLTKRTRTNCPGGYVQLTSDVCIQRNDSTVTDAFTATIQCRQGGARLCSWAEYVAACNVLGTQLNGRFDDWEWIDDTSDHTHTGNQVGRFTCRSQRAIGMTTTTSNYGAVRCCYRIP
ncbi:MAG: hypothetical protein JNL05_01680 [Flavobacteriales bacterium]|nr:hypothetical protein [Flavobacteriales bacterium]